MYSRKPQARPDPVMARYNVFLSAAKSGEDGLCFKEHTFRSQRSGVFAPKEKPVTWSVAVADDRVDGTGAHSLKYLVRKVINDNIQELGQDALKETPWVPFGHWIYDDAVATYCTPPPLSLPQNANPATQPESSMGSLHHGLPRGGLWVRIVFAPGHRATTATDRSPHVTQHRLARQVADPDYHRHHRLGPTLSRGAAESQGAVYHAAIRGAKACG